MHLDTKATGPTPSSARTVPHLRAVRPPADPGSGKRPGLMEQFRSESGYVALTIALDIISATEAVLLAMWLTPNDKIDVRGILPIAWLFIPMVVTILASRSMYRRKINHRFLDDLAPMWTGVAVASLATLTIMLLAAPPDPTNHLVTQVTPSETIVRVWFCAAILMPATRLLRSMAEKFLRRKYKFGAPALILGSGPMAHQLITRMRQVPEYGLRPVGIIDDVRPSDANVIDVPYLGAVADLERVARETCAKELIVAPSPLPDEQLSRTAQHAQDLGLTVRVVPRLMDAVSIGTTVDHLGGVPLMVLSHVNPKGWQFAVKHILGRSMAAVFMLLISPLFLTLMLLVKLSSPGPIFFRQQRVGRDGKVFDCLKFRSMRPLDPDKAAFELKDGAAPGGVEGEDRRTTIGKFMRKTSLDELPQFLNVVKGEMALVGPRPERPEFVELFDMQIRRYGQRHRVKAGITGWAQVHGLRGQTSIADRAEFDNYYIENWSLLLDAKILLLTVLAVLRTAED